MGRLAASVASRPNWVTELKNYASRSARHSPLTANKICVCIGKKYNVVWVSGKSLHLIRKPGQSIINGETLILGDHVMRFCH